MLTRWDPFREMLNMRDAMDRFFEGSMTTQQGERGIFGRGVPLDVIENDDEYLVKASLPGIKPEDLDITYQGNTLTIQGETKEEESREESRYHIQERRYGRFSRTITLPDINPEQIEANYTDGVLTLHLPKSEEGKPKRIQVQPGGSQKVLEARFENGKKKK